MPTFLTVNEAAQKTGKSTSSIRRLLIYPIVKEDHHAHRQHIEPNPDQVRALRLQGENFAWKISEEFLAREIAAKAATTSSKSGGKTSEETSEPDSTLILREQLEHNQTQLRVKDQQIAHARGTYFRPAHTRSFDDRCREIQRFWVLLTSTLATLVKV